MRILAFSGVVGLAVAVSAAFIVQAAIARTVGFELSTEFGHVHLDIDPDSGQVTGDYPDYNGRILGKVVSDDTIEGIWVQPGGNRPCKTEREGTVNWGRLVFKNPAGNVLDGHWGYCDESPQESWNGKILK